MMKLNLCLCILLLSCFIQAAMAWSSAGHMIVAAVAYQQLNDSQKKYVTEVLKNHPEYPKNWSKEYRDHANGMDEGAFLMMRASIWPDEIRGKENQYASYHHPEWHYITYRLDFETKHDTSEIDGTQQAQVVWASHNALAVLENQNSDAGTKAIYLSWLIHLIGDIHQPLHCASLFNANYPNGDFGGNLFFILINGKSERLHSIWDRALGQNAEGNETAIFERATLLHAQLKNRLVASNEFNPRQWSLESFRHALRDAHLNGTLAGSPAKEKAPALPPDYEKNMISLSELRCVQAGLRLGHCLNNPILK